MSEQQQYSNHTRMHPPFHYVLAPLLLIHFLYSVWQVIVHPDLAHADALLLSVALLLMAFLVRINPLKAQDRLIRLEEQLRYERVLPASVAGRARSLTVAQIVALRFAPDDELPELIDRIAAGQLTTSGDIKKAIRNWRGDYFRV